MKFTKIIPLCSTLALLSMTAACDREPESSLQIVRGNPLEADSPALNNVVGLSRDGRNTFCTGSVVADDLVVTAAHCVDDIASFYVVFGQPSLPMARIEVEKIDLYKPYGSAAFPNFDIAWLKLKTKVPARFKPMEILRDPARLKDAKEFRLAGYGIEETNCREESCRGRLLEAKTALDKYYDHPRLMSLLVFKGAAELGFGGACNGDSGGPAYARIGEQWFLIGVTNGATSYMTPESYMTPDVSCESGSDIYTFMGDYVPWIEKRSAQELMQKPESNPSRKEPPFLIKGEAKSADVAEPASWADWIQYPYHNEQAWNTVNILLYNLLDSRRSAVKPEERLKLWDDAVFSQAQMEQVTTLEFALSNAATQSFQDQPLDLRPLASWTGLQTLLLTDEAATLGIESVSKLPSLRSLTLVAPAEARRQNLNLSALQKQGNLNSLSLTNFAPAELQTLPFDGMKQLTRLQLAALSDQEAVALDLSGLRALRSLVILDWDYASKLALPQDLELNELIVDTDHRTDLQWLDISSIKSIASLKLGQEVLTSPEPFRRFQNKSIQRIESSGNELTAEYFPAAGFAELETALLSGNRINSTAFLKTLPTLKSVDLRDNPLTGTECPSNVSCTFDRIPMPQSVADFCRNTVNDREYSYTPMVHALLDSYGLSTYFYQDSSCDLLQAVLNQAKSLTLEADIYDYVFTKKTYDARLLGSLQELTSLKIRNMALARADALAELPKLTSLDLGLVKAKDLNFIQKMPQLVNLNYTDFPETTLEALSNPALKVVTLTTDGPRPYFTGGQLTSIGAKTALPALINLSVRGNPLQNLQGIEAMRTLTQLDISATKVTDLAPLAGLIGTTVFLGDGYKLDTCPILYGRCETGTRNLGGGVFGSDADSSLVSKWSAGQIVPGLGKALRN